MLLLLLLLLLLHITFPPPGTSLRQWLSTLDVMVLFEQALPNTLRLCR